MTLESKHAFSTIVKQSEARSTNNRLNYSNLEEKEDDSTVIKWANECARKLEKCTSRMENWTRSALATCVVLLLGIFYRGEWLLILVHFSQHFDGPGTQVAVAAAAETPTLEEREQDNSTSHSITWRQVMQSPYLRDFVLMWLVSVVSAYGIYFAVCGTLHWYYYVSKREKAEEWKCQPYKWISPEMERKEILHGFNGLFWTNTVTATFATYLLNGGPTMIYYPPDRHGYLWAVLQFPVLYLVMEYVTYWFHRFYHLPFMYKRFHKLHHGFKQPTAWSATAIHPVELINLQLLYISLLFVIPTHLFCFISIMLYNYYYGLLDHSGIKFKSWWQPWKPDSSFHDNHHQYTHVNYGFNMSFWDKLYGTHREKGRIYNENIFSGKGKDMSEATKEELEAYQAEVVTENKNIFKLSLFEKILKRLNVNL